MDKQLSINVTCKGADEKAIDELLEFQGEIKKLSKANLDKLKQSIIKYGFTAPIFIWEHKSDNYILDGHQRLKALCSLREEGYSLPLLPVVYVYAADIKEAKEKLLHITSQYGEFVIEQIDLWIEDIKIKIPETVFLTGGELKINNNISLDEIENFENDKSINSDNNKICPKCGFEW